MHRYAAALCLLTAVLDATQIVLVSASLGAVGGTLLYSAFAIGHARQSRWATWATILVPLLPLTLLGLWAVGIAVPRAPDGWMLGILGIQLAAAAVCLQLLRREPISGG